MQVFAIESDMWKVTQKAIPPNLDYLQNDSIQITKIVTKGAKKMIKVDDFLKPFSIDLQKDSIDSKVWNSLSQADEMDLQSLGLFLLKSISNYLADLKQVYKKKGINFFKIKEIPIDPDCMSKKWQISPFASKFSSFFFV